MGEFDFIKTPFEESGEQLRFSSRLLVGDKDIPILELQSGASDSSSCLPSDSIPGWKSLRPVDLSHSPWRFDRQTVTWQEQLLFKTESPPLLKPVELEDLPGFLARSGDHLPPPSDRGIFVRWKLPEGTHLYGLGQRGGPLERTGLRATNWTTDSPVGHNRTTDPLYQAHPLMWAVTGECWWALLLAHTGYSTFDLGQEKHDLLAWMTLGDGLTFQLHAASSPRELFASLSQVLAAPQAPPLWSLGFHQSRWGYKSAREVTELVNGFEERDLPLEAVHLDIDHMKDYRTFTFHPERFPEPERLFSDWRKRGVRVVTIVDPGLKFDTSGGYEPLNSGLEGDHFIKSSSGAPQVGFCWPDEALFPDFTLPSTHQWWAGLCRFYLDKGVDGLWIDMNEPAIFDRPFWSGRSQPEPMPLNTPWGEGYDHVRLRNIYGSCMGEATRKAWDDRKERPWVLTRSGFTGVGAVAWSWMGDNTSWWDHLALSLPQLASMGLVNSGFVGVDIGGFFGNCDGDLYGAWIEAGVIYPFMRAHSALGTAEQHPWSYGPEVEEIARKALNLRYKLFPYLYSTHLAHCLGDLPPLRPLFFDFPHENRFRYCQDQVLVGDHLMACPFVERGTDQRMVQMPPGRWYDFYTGRPVEQDSFVINRTHGHVPLFVREGTVLPLLNSTVRNSKAALQADWLIRFFPGEGERISELYWDGGDGPVGEECVRLRFEGGKLVESKVSARFEEIGVTVERAGEEGFSPWEHRLQLKDFVVGWKL